MKHPNTGLKRRLREQTTTPVGPVPSPGAAPSVHSVHDVHTVHVPEKFSRFDNPDDVEILLRLRRKKNEEESVKLPPPDRAGAVVTMTLDGIFSAWFDIGPARALDWLNYNTCNRAVNKGKVQSFARQILHGDYILTHQGAAFNDADELVDGQHFLKAIVMTGQTVRRMVTFGLPKKPAGKNFTTMDVIDSGGRSVSDQLKIGHGIKDSSALKQICGALSSICYGMRTRNLSVGQTLEVYHAFKGSIDFIIEHRSKQHGLRQAGLLAAFAFAHSAFRSTGGTPVKSPKGGPDPATIERLFLDLTTGSDLADLKTYSTRKQAGKDNRPLEHLRYFLTSDEAILIGKAMNREIAKVTLHVIYDELHNARTTALKEPGEVILNWFTAKQKDRVAQIAKIFTLPEKP